MIIRPNRRLPPVLTDERLDFLGREFMVREIREITGATFAQYVDTPDYYNDLARALVTVRWHTVMDPTPRFRLN